MVVLFRESFYVIYTNKFSQRRSPLGLGRKCCYRKNLFVLLMISLKLLVLIIIWLLECVWSGRRVYDLKILYQSLFIVSLQSIAKWGTNTGAILIDLVLTQSVSCRYPMEEYKGSNYGHAMNLRILVPNNIQWYNF